MVKASQVLITICLQLTFAANTDIIQKKSSIYEGIQASTREFDPRVLMKDCVNAIKEITAPFLEGFDYEEISSSATIEEVMNNINGMENACS